MDEDAAGGRCLAVLKRRRWLPTLVWCIAITSVSSLPDIDVTPDLFPGCDKIFHFIEYLILGVTLRFWSRRTSMLFLAGGIGFGALDELHQIYVPGRMASGWDFVADACGVATGFLICKRFLRKGLDG